jgi:hypothetical protein
MARVSDKDKLLQLINYDNYIGNGVLQNKLQWEPDKYWKVRDSLINAGLAAAGRGRGGSLIRIEKKEDRNQKIDKKDKEQILYGPLMRTLSKEWSRERQIQVDQVHFEITANMHSLKAGGKWSCPDITAISVRKFQHLPGQFFDVWTFEVKSIDSFDVTAIFEAAAHSSVATRSFSLLQIPEKLNDKQNDMIDRCVGEAGRLGVGLITFIKPDDFDTWETKLDSIKFNTSPEILNDFVGRFPKEAIKKMGEWK